MLYNEERVKLAVVRTPMPEAFARAFKNRAIFVASPGVDLDIWPAGGGWGTIMQTGGPTGSVRVVIRYGSGDLAVPASIALGSSVELHGFGLLSASSPPTQTGMNCQIKKPDGSYLTGYNNMSTKQNPGQELRFPLISFIADQAGVWQAIVRYYTYP